VNCIAACTHHSCDVVVDDDAVRLIRFFMSLKGVMCDIGRCNEPHFSHFAFDSQSLRDQFEIALQSFCNRISMTRDRFRNCLCDRPQSLNSISNHYTIVRNRFAIAATSLQDQVANGFAIVHNHFVTNLQSLRNCSANTAIALCKHCDIAAQSFSTAAQPTIVNHHRS
jgi:hypothetical protein